MIKVYGSSCLGRTASKFGPRWVMTSEKNHSGVATRAATNYEEREMLPIGQPVMLIAPFYVHDELAMRPPPIGATGEITAIMDGDGEYDVLFWDYPHQAINDHAWITHWLQIVPINPRHRQHEANEILNLSAIC